MVSCYKETPTRQKSLEKRSQGSEHYFKNYYKLFLPAEKPLIELIYVKN